MRVPNFTLLAALVALALPITLSAPLLAQPEKPSDGASELDQAKQHWKDALAKHESGDYIGAAEGYRKAYELFPKPLFLYNAAVVLRLGGQKQRALEHYKKYLVLEPDGKGSAGARKFVAILEAELQEASNPNTLKPDGGEPGKGAGDGAGSGSNSSDGTDPELAKPIPIVTRASIEGRGQGKRIAGLVVTGVGLALVGAGVGFGIHARSLSNEASEFQGPAGPDLDELYDRGDAADRNMVVLVSAGALTAVAGGMVYFLGVRDRSRAERELDFFIGPSGAGVSGRF